MVLRKGIFNLFIPLKLRLAVQADTGYVNNVKFEMLSQQHNYGMELRVAMMKSPSQN